MSTVRWDPFAEVVSLRDAMDSLLRESFVRPLASAVGGAAGVPLDVRETNDAFIVEASLPGVRPDQVQLQVKGDQLQISGDVSEEHEETRQGQWLMRERRQGHFQRSLTLPTPVQSDQARASFEHGVLRVTLPKAPQARATSIPIQAGQGSQALAAQTETEPASS